MIASYLAVPIATVFLLGILWKKATPASALTVMITGIPLGLLITWLVPHVFSSETVTAYSLDNFFIISGITQAFCIVIMVAVSLFTEPKSVDSISSLIFSGTKQLTCAGPKKPFYSSFTLWFAVFIAMYVTLYIILW